MSRDTDAANVSASQAENVILVVFLEMDFGSGPARVHSGVGEYTFGGNTFTGLGDLGEFSTVEEGAEIQTYNLSAQLSGIPSDMVQRVLGEYYQGRDARLWVGFLDAGHQLVADPLGPFLYRMDTLDVEVGATATASLTATSRLADWERPRVRRYTHADQIQQYPDDKGLEFVSQAADKELVWGFA